MGTPYVQNTSIMLAINIGQDPERFQNHNTHTVDEDLVPVDEAFPFFPVPSMVVVNVVSNQDIGVDSYHDLPLFLYRSPADFLTAFLSSRSRWSCRA